MKSFKVAWDLIWKTSVATVIAVSGMYLFGQILEILVKEGISDLVRYVFGFMYSLVVLGMIYKLTIHDGLKYYWDKRKGKGAESLPADTGGFHK